MFIVLDYNLININLRHALLKIFALMATVSNYLLWMCSKVYFYSGQFNIKLLVFTMY